MSLAPWPTVTWSETAIVWASTLEWIERSGYDSVSYYTVGDDGVPTERGGWRAVVLPDGRAFAYKGPGAHQCRPRA